MAHIVPCPRPALEAKLKAVNQSQQSIETTSKWMLFYKDDAASVVSCWQEEFRVAPSERALALLYLASHSIQESRKKGTAWTDAFSSIIIKAFSDFGRRGEEKHRKSAERIVKVWEDRKIFAPSLCKALKDSLSLASSSSAAAPSSSGQPPSAQQGGLSDHAKKLLHAAGKIPEALFEVLKAEHSSTSLLNKTSQIPPEISLPSSTASLDQVKSARETVATCLKNLQEELAARQHAISELKTCLSKHEHELTQVEERYRSMEYTQSQLDHKIRFLSNTSDCLPLSLPLPPMPPPQQLIFTGEGGAMMLPPSAEQIQAMLAQAASYYPPGVLPPPEVFFASILNSQGGGGAGLPSIHPQIPSAHPDHQHHYPPPPFPPSNGGGFPPLPTSAEEVEAQLMSHLQDPETRALVARSLAELMPPPPPHQMYHTMSHQEAAMHANGSGRRNSESVGFGSQISVASASGEIPNEVEYDPLNP